MGSTIKQNNVPLLSNLQITNKKISVRWSIKKNKIECLVTELAILDCVVRKVSEEVKFKLRSKWQQGAN